MYMYLLYVQGARMVYERESQIAINYSELEKKLKEVRTLHKHSCACSSCCVYRCMYIVCVLCRFVKREKGREERGERKGARIGRCLSASSVQGQPKHPCKLC